jgi:hypothetical protein
MHDVYVADSVDVLSDCWQQQQQQQQQQQHTKIFQSVCNTFVSCQYQAYQLAQRR